jgi:hypothetical protein
LCSSSPIRSICAFLRQNEKGSAAAGRTEEREGSSRRLHGCIHVEREARKPGADSGGASMLCRWKGRRAEGVWGNAAASESLPERSWCVGSPYHQHGEPLPLLYATSELRMELNCIGRQLVSVEVEWFCSASVC